MASSLETNKILAAILTAGIFASGAGVMSRIIYHPTVPEEPSYIIEVAEVATGGEADEGAEQVPIATLLASADVGAGEGDSSKCSACHTFEEGGADKIGPNLYGILGRDIASVSGFAYSDALTGIEGDWTYESLDAFLESPKGFAPGTKMAYAGMRSAEDRADMILYLRSLAAAPLPLPEAETDTAEETSGGEGEEEVAAADAAVEQAEDVVEEAQDAADEVAAAAADVVESAEETAAAAVETVTDAASDAADAVEEAATDAAKTAENLVEDAVEQAADAAETVTAAATDAVDSAADTADAAVDAAASGLVAMIAEGDVAKGEKVSKKCKACHVFEEGGKNKLGPALWGIVDADIASRDGFNYSGALSELEGAWTYDRLDQFLAAPKNYIPGTKMVFAGVKKEQDRADLIAYLRTLAAEPAPLN